MDTSSSGWESKHFDRLPVVRVVQDQLDKDESEVDPKKLQPDDGRHFEEKSNCWYDNAFHLTFALVRCGPQGLKYPPIQEIVNSKIKLLSLFT